MKVIFLVEIRKKEEYFGFDVQNVIWGWDDFIPQEFETEEEAINFIKEREFGRYTITKIYKVDENKK